MNRKFISVLAAFMLVLSFGSASAFADGTVPWRGNGSDAAPCTGQYAGYTHWIFTTGGNSSVTSATLTVDGTGGYQMAQNGNGSWSYYVLGGLPNSASIAYTGNLGSGNAVLTISCLGTPVPTPTPKPTPTPTSTSTPTPTPKPTLTPVPTPTPAPTPTPTSTLTPTATPIPTPPPTDIAPPGNPAGGLPLTLGFLLLAGTATLLGSNWYLGKRALARIKKVK